VREDSEGEGRNRVEPDSMNAGANAVSIKSTFLVCMLLSAVFLAGVDSALASQNPPSAAAESVIQLIAPSPNYRVSDQALMFKWQLSDTAGMVPQYYELLIRAKYRDFSIIRQVTPADYRKGLFIMSNLRSQLRKHGHYSWQVHAVTEDGRRFVSETRDLVIEMPGILKSDSPTLFPYAIKWERTDRLNCEEFNQLTNNAYPRIHLEGHSNFCLVFRQPFVRKLNLDLEEQVLLNSRVGLGGQLNIRWRLYENVFFAFHPTANSQICWYGPGLQRFASLRSQIHVGLDFIVNPKGYISSTVRWVPAYRFHYAIKDDGIRTFEGEGWEWGLRIVIPRHILTPFTVAGLPVDFERMPIEFVTSRIKDDFTGVTMPVQTIGISFLFE
jgi:hypothetical protein